MKSRKKKSAPPPAFVAAVIPTESYIVTRDDRACTLINVSGMPKGGVLLPGVPAVTFAKHRDAERAIDRTRRARESLHGSLVSEWLSTQIPSFLDGISFEIVPIGHQGGDPRLQKPAVTKEELEHSRL